MEDKALFEIPIYYISRSNHDKKWLERKELYIEELMRRFQTEEEAKNSFVRCFKMESTWDFNKIVGYIRIIYNNRNGELQFFIFKSINKKFSYNKIFKMSFERIIGPNLHVYIKNKNNNEINLLISEKIEYIMKIYFKKNNYIDLTCYNNVSKYYDFEKFIKFNGSD